jgi:hypothetical protein
MMRRTLIAAVLLGLALELFVQPGAALADDCKAEAPGVLVLKAENGEGIVAVLPSLLPLKAGQQFELVLTLCGAAAGGEISAVDAMMPKHGRGMNYRAQVFAGEQPGLFRAEGLLLHMAGEWRLTADARRDGQRVRYTAAVMVSP